MNTQIATSRWVGKCRRCRVPVVVTGQLEHARMFQHDCGAWVVMDQVIAKRSNTRCGARCTGATGPACSCECGGENHGSRFIGGDMLPGLEQLQLSGVWDA